MKTTLTFEAETDEERDTEPERIALEKHLRGPSIAEALESMYGAVYEKVHGRPKGIMSAAIVAAADPPESWQEVLDLLDEHTSDVADLL